MTGSAGIPINCYAIIARVEGGYYHSPEVADVFPVFDPSAGFATGGGWFYWPGTRDKTNFGFVTSCGKKGSDPKGSLVMVRHTEAGNYRIKSNAITILAIGESSDASGSFGWCSFTGKATYAEPGWETAVGSHTFAVYAEDRNEPGKGVDRFWIETREGTRVLRQEASMTGPGAAHAVGIGGGNIAMPHNTKVK